MLRSPLLLLGIHRTVHESVSGKNFVSLQRLDTSLVSISMMEPNKIRLFALLVASFLLVSCGEVAKVRQVNDVSLAYDYAKKFYNEGKYKQVVDLLPSVVSAYNGTVDGSRALYMLAYSEMELKHYSSASEYFQHYYSSYPKGEQVEDARFYSGVCLYHSAPDPRLDQTITHNAIQELQVFNENYPQSKHRSQVKELLFTLQDRLAEKELLAAKQYYDLGMFLGNNYKSAIITANNALKDYPYSKFREEFYMVILRATYQEAMHSIESKQQARYRDVADRYFIYSNEFPKGKYIKEANRIYQSIEKLISKDA